MPHPTILLCCDPFAPRTVDAAFGAEHAAAQARGLPIALFDHDGLDRTHDAGAALRRTRIEAVGEVPGLAVYRGWMLRADDYRRLYEALLERGLRLINTPEQYAACHHVPDSHPHIKRWAAPTTWVPAKHLDDPAAIQAALAPFGNEPVIVKDWVKAQAAYWSEACFIPSAADAVAVARVVGRFRALQGDSLAGGVVFRAYVPLAQVGGEVEEWRAFVLDGQALGVWPRFAGVPSAEPPAALVAEAAAALPSRFATVDFARRADGGWLLIETGDGQVSGLPDGLQADTLFSALEGIVP